MSYIEADDGCRLFYDVRGNADQAVVLVPGLGGDGRFWDGVATLIVPHLTVISVDHRGAGRSERPDNDSYTIERIAADTKQILDAAGFARVHAVGHSTGGTVVQVMALNWPQSIDHLVISASWERADARFRKLFEVRLAMLEQGMTREYQAMTQILGHSVDYLQLHSDRLDSELDLAEARLMPLSVTCARVRMLLNFDSTSMLDQIQAPTLVIGATDDIMVPLHHSLAIAAAINGARMVQMTGGHFYPLTSPRQMAKHILDHFFSKA